MAVPLKKPVDLFDYLEFDDASQGRHEFESGTVYAMTGGTMRHNRVTGNIFRMLANRLDGSACQVFVNDFKLHVKAADSVYYPDVFVYCGSTIANEDLLVTDAKLVVEVLSDSTAARDRRQKRVAYQKLPGLQAYWIVSQTEQRVEVHSRDAEGQWQARAYGVAESIATDWLGDEAIPLASMYTGTDIAA
jgi:Uma2 family endonuclease